MHEQPEPTPEEHEQDLERRQDEDAMRYPGHDDPHAVEDPGATLRREDEQG